MANGKTMAIRPETGFDVIRAIAQVARGQVDVENIVLSRRCARLLLEVILEMKQQLPKQPVSES